MQVFTANTADLYWPRGAETLIVVCRVNSSRECLSHLFSRDCLDVYLLVWSLLSQKPGLNVWADEPNLPSDYCKSCPLHENIT